MSWTTNTPAPIGKEGTLEIPTPPFDQRAAGEAEMQFSYAVDAAKLLAAAIGRPEDEILVGISGHANPDHAPAEGYSHEFVTLTVSAKPKS